MVEAPRSAHKMVELFKEDNTLLTRLKADADPVPLLEEVARKAERETAAWVRDKLVYRLAVFVLGSLALITAIGSIALVYADKEIPEVLVALGSAAVGALVGLFAPTPSG